ncbi:prepilin-type N-terminal cleavage/methylation domain-containing protein [Heliobacterium chlorum]|uniref:Prepilin-type N-terminal cleavage/methylation domain-containing protein n=1 Tax=Heliobacterium chlorum TaxID=2698 RepID=A0ABR7T537_HELCL|nr:prepilin-type N-terminal cleavage/methylation domain-containing protein [Heliobacterium chlorum]
MGRSDWIIKRLFLNRRGFTITELLIVLALLSVVLTFGYNAFGFMNTSFVYGESRSNVQREIQTASNKITSELRNAVRVSNTAFGDENQYYHIWTDSSKSLRLETLTRTGAITASTNLCNQDVTAFSCAISKDQAYKLTFTLQGKDDNMANVYSLSSCVMLNNVTQGTTLSNEIFYTKP